MLVFNMYPKLCFNYTFNWNIKQCKSVSCKPALSLHFLKLRTTEKSHPSQVSTVCLHQLCVSLLLSVPCLCRSTVCHFCAHVRLRIFMCFGAWLSNSATWLSLPSHFRERRWQGWGKQIIKKKHCCPPQGKTRPASPYGVSSACQSGLPWCYLQLFFLSPLSPRVMCGQLFKHRR